MANKERSWGKVVGIGLVVLALGAGSVWAGRYWLAQRADDELRARLAGGAADEVRAALLALDKEKLDIAVDSLRDRSFSDMRQIMRREDLTEEERRQLREVMHQVRTTHMDERVEEYFDAPPEEREALLDRHIDEMLEHREQRRARREQGGDDDSRADRERMRRQPPKRDRQSAKERMEGGDPDGEKRRMTYWRKMRSRMQARGLEMRGGPGGPRGGRGPGGASPQQQRSERRQRD